MGAAQGSLLCLQHELLQLQRVQHRAGQGHLSEHGWVVVRCIEGYDSFSSETTLNDHFLRFLLLPDAQLLTIGSTEENDFVSKYINEDPLITNRVWLGMDINAQGNLK